MSAQIDGGAVLVLGGHGFVGVNLVNRLLKDGNYEMIRVYDNLSRPSPTGAAASDTVQLIQGDIRDADALRQAMRGVKHIVHLAAYGSVVDSVADPITNFDVNARGTLTVLETARDCGVEKLLFASTGGALIGDAAPPVSELSLPRPISPYGASKLCGESYGYAFHKAYGLPFVSLRFANVYGPHSAHKKGVITTYIKNLMRGKPLVIYGDGTTSRDYIHVEDLCAGIVAALAVAPGGEVFHVASGVETPVQELSGMLADIAGKPEHPVQFEDLRRGEVARNFANFDKAREVLGFEPTWSLRAGLEDTWNWFRQQDEATLSVETGDS